MSGYASLTAARRAFYVLTALRWLPTGLLIPITVLFMTSRGLSLAEVGLAVAASSVVILVLELPTGGLADAWGRRPVLAIAATTAVASTAMLLVADSFVWFALAWMLNGVYRALDSGPLEAWYVDAALAADPGRRLERDLSGAGVALYAAVAAGSLLVAGLGVIDGSWDPLTAAVATSLVMQVVNVLAVLLLVREVRPARGPRAAWIAAAQAPRVVAESVRLGWGRRPLRLLLAVELSWGAGLTAVELLWQPLTNAELGDAEDIWLFGLMGASAWIAGAAGAALLPGFVRLTKGRVTWAAALLRLVQGAATVGLGLGGGVAGILTAFIAFYTVHGMSNPAHFALLHRRVESSHRTTVMSLNSLVSRLSGLPAGIAFGILADGAGAPLGMIIAGLLLVTGAPLYLMSGEPARPSEAAADAPVSEPAPAVAG